MVVQELLWHYRSRLSQFQRARMQLQRITSRGRRDDILKELGEHSLMEIYLWAIIAIIVSMRHRPRPEPTP